MVISRESGSLESRVYEALEDAILAGEFKAGTPLTELGVSEKLGVKITVVCSDGSDFIEKLLN